MAKRPKTAKQGGVKFTEGSVIYHLYGEDYPYVWDPEATDVHSGRKGVMRPLTKAEDQALSVITEGGHRYKYKFGRRSGWLDDNKAFLNLQDTVKSKSFKNRSLNIFLDLETTGLGNAEAVFQISMHVTQHNVKTGEKISTLFNFDALQDPRLISDAHKKAKPDEIIEKGAQKVFRGNITYGDLAGKALSDEQLEQMIYLFEHAGTVTGHNVRDFDAQRLYGHFRAVQRTIKDKRSKRYKLITRLKDAIHNDKLRWIDTQEIPFGENVPEGFVPSLKQEDILANPNTGRRPGKTLEIDGVRIHVETAHSALPDTLGNDILTQFAVVTDEGEVVAGMQDSWTKVAPGFPQVQTRAGQVDQAKKKKRARAEKANVEKNLYLGDDGKPFVRTKKLEFMTDTAEEISEKIKINRTVALFEGTLGETGRKMGWLGVGIGMLGGFTAYRFMSKSPAQETLDRWAGDPSDPFVDAMIAGGLGAATWNANKIVPGYPNLKASLSHVMGDRVSSFGGKIARFGSLGLLGYAAVSTTHNILNDRGRPGEKMRHPTMAAAVGLLGVTAYGIYGSAGYDADLAFGRAFTGIRDRLMPGTRKFGELYNEAGEKIAQKVEKGVMSGGGYFAETFNALAKNIRQSKMAKGTIIGGIGLALGSYVMSGSQNNKVIPPSPAMPSRQPQMIKYNQQTSRAMVNYKPGHVYRHPYRHTEQFNSRPHGLALV